MGGRGGPGLACLQKKNGDLLTETHERGWKALEMITFFSRHESLSHAALSAPLLQLQGIFGPYLTVRERKTPAGPRDQLDQYSVNT